MGLTGKTWPLLGFPALPLPVNLKRQGGEGSFTLELWESSHCLTHPISAREAS